MKRFSVHDIPIFIAFQLHANEHLWSINRRVFSLRSNLNGRCFSSNSVYNIFLVCFFLSPFFSIVKISLSLVALDRSTNINVVIILSVE